MAESNQPKESFSNERAELIKNSLLNAKNNFVNVDNQKFARVQSTPIEEQQKKGGGFLKARLLAKQSKQAGVEFNPNAETTSVTESFLKTSTQTSSTETKPVPQNGALPNFTSGITPFTPKEGGTTLSSASQSFQLPQATTTPATGVTATTTTGTAGSSGTTEKKSLAKTRLKLTSQLFPAPTSAPFDPTQKTVVQPNTGTTQQTTTLATGKSTGKTSAEEKKVDKNTSPSKINLKTMDFGKEKKPLESIPEKKEENKQEVQKTEEKPAPVIENKKPDVIPVPSTEFTEVKPKGKKTETKPLPPRKYDFSNKNTEQQKPVTTIKEEQKPVEEPKVEIKPEVKKEEKKDEKKVEEKQFTSPAKKEVKIEIVVMSRKDFTEAVAQWSEALKGKPIPENLQKYVTREIITESQRGKPNRQQTGGNFDRSKKQEVIEKPDDGISRRTTSMKDTTPEAPKTFVRLGLTPEELEMKEKLSKNVNAWIAGKKGETDPEEQTRKDIKFNLNIITLDNFEVIKEKILEIASKGIDNCRKVSEFLIENAWTQKQYVNTYAKLCDFLGKQDKLNFDEVKDAKKKKNDFKLQILKKIQTVFEEESYANLGFKKPVEEMAPEERSLFYFKKKQRILGNVSFIGELFLEKFIVIGVVRIITNSLLAKFLHEYDEYQKAEIKPQNKNYEDTLEGLLKFYEIIGKAVEDKETSKSEGKGKEKPQKPSNVVANFQKVLKAINSGTPSDVLPKLGEDEASLEDLFKIYDIMLSDANLTPRLDSLVKNLIYRKDNKWQAPLTKNQGPKTMRELHEEFEREQIEAERRADEYREELRDSYYYNQPRNTRSTKTEYVFQVASDNKERRQEEAKVDMGPINVDTNISFRPQRGKQDVKGSADKPKINFDQIERDLKDVYKLIGGEEIEDKTSPEEEVKKTAEKHGGRNVIKIYLKTFHDGRLEAIPKRLFVPNLLIENKLITEDEFIALFQEALNKMYDVFCDSPNLDKNCAVIMLDLCKKTGNGEPFKKINFTQEFYDNEESEYILEFYHEFFKAILDYLNKDYADLKEKITEETLKEFAKKIKYENY